MDSYSNINPNDVMNPTTSTTNTSDGESISNVEGAASSNNNNNNNYQQQQQLYSMLPQHQQQQQQQRQFISGQRPVFYQQQRPGIYYRPIPIQRNQVVYGRPIPVDQFGRPLLIRPIQQGQPPYMVRPQHPQMVSARPMPLPPDMLYRPQQQQQFIQHHQHGQQFRHPMPVPPQHPAQIEQQRKMSGQFTPQHPSSTTEQQRKMSGQFTPVPPPRKHSSEPKIHYSRPDFDDTDDILNSFSNTVVLSPQQTLDRDNEHPTTSPGDTLQRDSHPIGGSRQHATTEYIPPQRHQSISQSHQHHHHNQQQQHEFYVSPHPRPVAPHTMVKSLSYGNIHQYNQYQQQQQQLYHPQHYQQFRPSTSRKSSLADTVSSLQRIPETQQLIYPALLSQVGKSFRNLIPLSSHVKYAMDYQDSFTGKEAVDVLSSLIKSSDRNLSLLLGRALDSQMLFNDVTWNHRLRDSKNEIYQLQNPTTVVDDSQLPTGVFTLLTDCYAPTCTREQLCYSIACPRRLEQQARVAQQSKTESSETKQWQTSWSQSVPSNIVDSVSKQELKRQESIFEYIQGEYNFILDMEALVKHVIKPLEVEFPGEFSERVFCNLTEIIAVNAKLARRLRLKQTSNSIVDTIGEDLVSYFSNNSLEEIYVEYAKGHVHAKHYISVLRGEHNEVMKWIDDVAIRKSEFRKLPLDSFIAAPFRLTKSKLQLESILKVTPESHPDKTTISKALALELVILEAINVATGKADNRLKLDQLESALIMSASQEFELSLSNPLRYKIREGNLVLKRGNSESDMQVMLLDHVLLLYRKKNNDFKIKGIIPLDLMRLSSPPVESVKSGKKDKNSSISSSGGGGSNNTTNNTNNNSKDTNSGGGSSSSTSVVGVGRASLDSNVNTSGGGSYNIRRQSSESRLSKSKISRQGSLSNSPSLSRKDTSGSLSGGVGVDRGNITKDGSLASSIASNLHIDDLALYITHFGRGGQSYYFQCPTESDRNAWVEDITQQINQRNMRNLKFRIGNVFKSIPQLGRIYCVYKYNNNNNLTTEMMLVGTENGLFKYETTRPDEFLQLLKLDKVYQVDTLGDQLLILAEKVFYAFPLDIIHLSSSEQQQQQQQAETPISPISDSSSSNNNNTGGASGGGGLEVQSTRGKKICDKVTFFKRGECNNKSLVCAIKSTTLSATVKVYELNDNIKKGFLNKVTKSGTDLPLKIYKEFYIPTESASLLFLKTKVCVACSKGFEIVDLESLSTQGLLDPSDPQLSFVKSDSKPVSLFRIQSGEFFLCYDMWGFYVDNRGRRARPNFLVTWNGTPTQFWYVHPWVLAFDAGFVEVRHVDTGVLEQVLVLEGGGCRTLNLDGVFTCDGAVGLLGPDDFGQVNRLEIVDT